MHRGQQHSIIDAHIHAYPREVFRDARGWGEAQQEPWWTEAVAPLNRRSIQGWADIDQLLRDMDAANVEQVVMLGWYWQRQATCAQQNQWFIEWHRQHPDRIHAFAAANVSAGSDALHDVQRALDAGLCGIGELLPQVQGYTLRDDTFCELAALAATQNVPINLHVTDPKLNGRPGMVATPLSEFVRTARDHPDTTFILAHCGGGLAFVEPEPPPNVYYDTAATPLIYDRSVYRRLIDTVGVDRVLFGTDYPLRLYPRYSSEPEFGRMITDIRQAGLTDTELRAVLGNNVRRLLRLA